MDLAEVEVLFGGVQELKFVYGVVLVILIVNLMAIFVDFTLNVDIVLVREQHLILLRRNWHIIILFIDSIRMSNQGVVGCVFIYKYVGVDATPCTLIQPVRILKTQRIEFKA